jgi:hypothetical protein
MDGSKWKRAGADLALFNRGVPGSTARPYNGSDLRGHRMLNEGNYLVKRLKKG